MNTETKQFRIRDLLSSVINAVSSHSPKWNDTISVVINEDTFNPLYGDAERLQRALIIIVEHALIHHHNIPVTLTGSVIRKTENLATLLFWVTQHHHATPPFDAAGFHQLHETATKTGVSTKQSMEVAERLANECGGNLLIRPRHPLIHEIFLWAPMALSSDPDSPPMRRKAGKEI